MSTSRPNGPGNGAKRDGALPGFARRVLGLLFPESIRAVVLADIEAAYRRDVENLGPARARGRLLAELLTSTISSSRKKRGSLVLRHQSWILGLRPYRETREGSAPKRRILDSLGVS